MKGSGIVERAPSAPMSEQAMRLKAEPWADLSGSSASLKAEADRVRPEGGQSSFFGRQQQQQRDEADELAQLIRVAPRQPLGGFVPTGLSVYPFQRKASSSARAASRGSSRGGLDLGDDVTNVQDYLDDDDEDDGEVRGRGARESKQDNDEEDEDEEEDEEEDEDDDFGYEEEGGSGAFLPAPESLFLQMWRGLDELFSRCGPALTRQYEGMVSASAGPDFGLRLSGGGNMRGDVKAAVRDLEEDLQGLEADHLRGAGRQRNLNTLSSVIHSTSDSLRTFVERGVASAEGVLQLPLFLPPAAMAQYTLVKAKVLSVMDTSGGVVALKSSQWAALGVLVVDGIVRRRALVPSGPPPSETERETETETETAAEEEEDSQSVQSEAQAAQSEGGAVDRMAQRRAEKARAMTREVVSAAPPPAASANSAHLWDIKVNAVVETLLSDSLRQGDLEKLKTFFADL
jgi:hypothetical protein